jgi:2-polyprenyl-6-methoxyphenol hydroxylase-like FAD-dependent oxidoreductase
MSAFDVQVLGAGIVGKSLALTLARQGLRVAWRGRPPGATPREDVRAYALNPASAALLRGLRVWDALPADAVTTVHDIQVHGDAPGAELQFSAWQQRVAELAWIVDAAALERELEAALRFAPHVTAVSEDVDAELLAICEGGASAARRARGIGFERHDYGQRAIAARVLTERPHRGIAYQWFGSPDVLALLPFDRPQPGHCAALVWSLPEARADALMAADEAGFVAALAEATDGTVGAVRLASARAAWPLQLGRAEGWTGEGWALLGDAAHLVHPLAGQGLNLGLADVAALAHVLAGREPWRPLGDARLLRRYERARAAPTWAMAEVTDGLLRLFAHDAASWKELRNRGLTLVDRWTPAKRWLAAQALGS